MDDKGNVVGLRHDFRSQSVVPAEFKSSQRKRKEKGEKKGGEGRDRRERRRAGGCGRAEVGQAEVISKKVSSGLCPRSLPFLFPTDTAQLPTFATTNNGGGGGAAAVRRRSVGGFSSSLGSDCAFRL